MFERHLSESVTGLNPRATPFILSDYASSPSTIHIPHTRSPSFHPLSHAFVRVQTGPRRVKTFIGPCLVTRGIRALAGQCDCVAVRVCERAIMLVFPCFPNMSRDNYPRFPPFAARVGRENGARGSSATSRRVPIKARSISFYVTTRNADRFLQ